MVTLRHDSGSLIATIALTGQSYEEEGVAPFRPSVTKPCDRERDKANPSGPTLGIADTRYLHEIARSFAQAAQRGSLVLVAI